MVPALVKWFTAACRFRILESSSKHFSSSNIWIVASIKTHSYTAVRTGESLYVNSSRGKYLARSVLSLLSAQSAVSSELCSEGGLHYCFWFALLFILVHGGLWGARGRWLEFPFDVPHHGWHLIHVLLLALFFYSPTLSLPQPHHGCHFVFLSSPVTELCV